MAPHKTFSALRALSLALATLCALSASVFAVCTTAPQQFDNPAGRMDSSLQTLAHQTGCFIEFDPNIAPYGKVRAIKGTFTPIEALWATLKGTGWEGHLTPGGLSVNRQDQVQVLTRVFMLKQQVKWAVGDGLLTRNRGLLLTHQLDQAQESVQSVVRTQGFVSAGEQASYGRTISDVTKTVNNR